MNHKEALMTLRNGKPLPRDVRNECCDVLAKLVDKEEAKVLKIKTDKDGRTIWVCPKCNRTHVKFWSDIETISPYDYCWNCGQKLDWNMEVKQ